MLIATSAFAGLLPLVLVLACPLVMIFMMRGMHRDGGPSRGAPGEPTDSDTL